jgi:hypothetical protein
MRGLDTRSFRLAKRQSAASLERGVRVLRSAMEIGLEDLVPWGRRLSEYTRIFQLTSEQLRQRILGCADGPSSFNAEITRRGG